MTITTLILLWICRILFTGLTIFCWVWLLFFEGNEVSLTYPVEDEEGHTFWKKRPLTFLERQDRIWCNDLLVTVWATVWTFVPPLLATLLWLNL